MSQEHKTKAGMIIHSMGLFIHNLFDRKVTADDVKHLAEDIAATANVYAEVANETKDITDPAAKVEAICKSVLAHEGELPADVKGGNFEKTVVGLCQKLSGLPLEEVEALVKGYLGK
jgi:hypothetical protein